MTECCQEIEISSIGPASKEVKHGGRKDALGWYTKLPDEDIHAHGVTKLYKHSNNNEILIFHPPAKEWFVSAGRILGLQVFTKYDIKQALSSY